MAQEPLTYPADARAATESTVSAISWAAIFGGAVAAAAISIVLVLIGSGFGLAMASPWPNSGASATTFTVAAGIWVIVVQWVSSGMGGFITGRLRTKWVRLHTHEVFFRDTAHGLLTWSLATVFTALLIASAGSSVLGTGTRAAATVASGAAQGAGMGAGVAGAGAANSSSAERAYDIDGLFRGETSNASAGNASAGNASAGAGPTGSTSGGAASGGASSGQASGGTGSGGGGDARGEATRIFAHDMVSGDMPAADRTYLTSLVAQRTGISQEEAQKRVDAAIAQEKAAETKARQAADTARKSTSAAAIFTAISMLIGAFIASAAAAYGGSLRDEHF
jgi:hypothetical protein